MTSPLLKVLCNTNRQILRQKIDLISLLREKHTQDLFVNELFCKQCPIVKASIGQHYRHSLDHIERATSSFGDNIAHNNFIINYDERSRQTPDENSFFESIKRMEGIMLKLDRIEEMSGNGVINEEDPVDVAFILDSAQGNSSTLTKIPSTVSRELAFAAHHAIHHLSMVRIIATCKHVGQLSEDSMPSDFGKAPSTVEFEKS